MKKEDRKRKKTYIGIEIYKDKGLISSVLKVIEVVILFVVIFLLSNFIK